MNKFISFLKQSNRYKHLIGGFIVGICALSPWNALYSAAVAASCLELKDVLPLGLFRLAHHGRRRRNRRAHLAVYLTVFQINGFL